MTVDVSKERINKILEKQNADFKLVDNEDSKCSLYIDDVDNEKAKKMQEKLFEDLKEIAGIQPK